MREVARQDRLLPNTEFVTSPDFVNAREGMEGVISATLIPDNEGTNVYREDGDYRPDFGLANLELVILGDEVGEKTAYKVIRWFMNHKLVSWRGKKYVVNSSRMKMQQDMLDTEVYRNVVVEVHLQEVR